MGAPVWTPPSRTVSCIEHFSILTQLLWGVSSWGGQLPSAPMMGQRLPTRASPALGSHLAPIQGERGSFHPRLSPALSFMEALEKPPCQHPHGPSHTL